MPDDLAVFSRRSPLLVRQAPLSGVNSIALLVGCVSTNKQRRSLPRERRQSGVKVGGGGGGLGGGRGGSGGRGDLGGRGVLGGRGGVADAEVTEVAFAVARLSLNDSSNIRGESPQAATYETVRRAWRAWEEIGASPFFLRQILFGSTLPWIRHPSTLPGKLENS